MKNKKKKKGGSKMKKMSVVAVLFVTMFFLVTISQAAETVFAKNGELVSITADSDNDQRYHETVKAFSSLGWIHQKNDGSIPMGTKGDAWCHAEIKDAIIYIGCYTPHAGHGLEIRNEAMQAAEAPAILGQLLKQYRSAAATIGLN